MNDCIEFRVVYSVLLFLITKEAMYTEARSCNHCCCGKAISIMYSECVFVAFSVQHAMRTRHIAVCGLPHSTKCAFRGSLQLSYETFLILRRNEREMIKKKIVHWSSCKLPLIRVRF